MGCKQPGAPWRRRRWARSLSEVEPSRRTERSRWVSLSNPSNEWGGEFPVCSTPPTAPASYSTKWPRFVMQFSVYHAMLCFRCRPLLTMRPRFTKQATACHTAPGLPYSHRFTEYPSAYHAGHGLPCDARFPLQATVYRVAICLPHTPLLTAPPLQALPQHPAALPALCITSHHTATSPLHHPKAYDVPACLL